MKDIAGASCTVLSMLKVAIDQSARGCSLHRSPSPTAKVKHMDKLKAFTDQTSLQPGASTLFSAHDEPLTTVLLDFMQQLGLVAIEIADYHSNFDYRNNALLDQMRGWMEDRGLALNSIHAHFEKRQPGSDLASPDPVRRKASVAFYRLGLQALAVLGGNILVTHHIGIPSPDRHPEEHGQRRCAFLASLQELAPIAADLDVRLAIENGGAGWRADVRHLTALIDESHSSPAVGVCLDTGHRHLNGDVAEAVHQLGSHLITLHVHDNHGHRDEHIMPFSGTISWRSVMAALREISYPGVFMYEVGSTANPRDIPANYHSLMAALEHPG